MLLFDINVDMAVAFKLSLFANFISFDYSSLLMITIMTMFTITCSVQRCSHQDVFPCEVVTLVTND